ncbi:hypothetical protein [Blattabacterium cuenoti]|uniref:hypothetical protein n=1 Tax=Blattabacterium cuenoti TaxID=1653831 RepID=UPI00163B9E15|nr:hypothetical protein [Blattabacterium cuenoti]
MNILNKKKILFFLMIIGFFILFYEKIYSSINLKNNFFLEKKNYIHQTIDNKNKPWISLYISLFYFTTISLGSLLFLSIQSVSKSGWSIIIHPIMEVVASFIPYGGIMIFILLLFNSIDIIHLFHWMDSSLYNSISLKYDKLIESKRLFLNIPFFLIRSLIYIIGWSFFYFKIKKISHKLDITHSLNDYKKLYFFSIFFIIFFSITSIIMGWDWIMSLNPHWFSTLLSWYILSTYLVTGIGTITIISIYMKKKGYLPFFNKNHLHDLSKYLFSTSLLWSYFWFSQFLLYWYGNIPEEISYFIRREESYGYIHFWMLIFNFLIPFFGLMSSKNKTNPKIVLPITYILLFGHYLDIYNLIKPEIMVSFKNSFFFIFSEEIGALLLIGSIFLFILFKNLHKNKLNPIGNPFFQESKKYKYPYM